MLQNLNAQAFSSLCTQLAAQHEVFRKVIDLYGYPPYWTRPNTFATLVLTILEQQVSLASAFAAYKKLQEKLDNVTPKNLLAFTDEELRACYFSRQKISYTRGLTEAVLTQQINLEAFEEQPDDVVRIQLKALKGIGDWTVDVYLMHALQRPDILPIGDIALMNGYRMLTGNMNCSKEEIVEAAEAWRPYRSIATMIIWHYYIRKKNLKVFH